ncbi:FmdE family protein [Archaeoglobus neptunius]|uniref:FmdE family protein n=1 Tax=Archaeoglobus neptunius TaxID=2798580 RepID=UPI001925856B|nr:FmdE family protein [Archaeoglobus neptunius]
MDEIEFATRLHGHLSPGVALGIRMARIAYSRLNVGFRGKGLVGIAETSMCIPDALQIVAGTTPGNRNLVVRDYGKLALSIVRFDTKEGYRVAIRKEAASESELIRKFLFRLGKLSREDEKVLAEEFLSLDERFFDVKKIRLTIPVGGIKEPIVECEVCGELQPADYVVEKDGGRICFTCSGDVYFEVI